MNYKIQIIALEIELHKIREHKAFAVKQIKYNLAAELRDLEKAKSKEIFDLVEVLKKRFTEIEISSSNFQELHELSKIIFYYQNNINPIMYEKVKSKIKNLKLQKEEAILFQNFKLRNEFNDEIEYLKKNVYKF